MPHLPLNIDKPGPNKLRTHILCPVHRPEPLGGPYLSDMPLEHQRPLISGLFSFGQTNPIQTRAVPSPKALGIQKLHAESGATQFLVEIKVHRLQHNKNRTDNRRPRHRDNLVSGHYLLDLHKMGQDRTEEGKYINFSSLQSMA